MTLLFYIIAAVVAEILVSLIGIFFVFFGYTQFKKYLQYFVSFSVGTFLGVIFFEILPEAVEISTPDTAFFYTLIGFMFFFLFSRILHWYHHHEESCSEHEIIKASGYMVLAGDLIHNFIDGIIITLAFLVDINIGILTTTAVLFHEFPQEVSDFFVLINSGFSKTKALLLNFLVSFTTLIGALITYFTASNIEKVIGPALGIVAGNFLYISMSDLIPELNHDNKNRSNTVKQFLLILLGITLIYLIVNIIPE